MTAAELPPLPEPAYRLKWERENVYDADQMREYGDARAKAARAEALEEAAKACEQIATAYRELYKCVKIVKLGQRFNPHTDGCSDGAYEGAEAVRALMKEQG